MSENHARVDYPEFAALAPQVHAALLALGQAVDASGLDKTLTEIVKLRVSQRNGCAFCIQFHLGVARKLGVPQAKLDLLAAWRDAGVFSRREMRALAWAECLDDLTGAGGADDVHEALSESFTQAEIVMLTTAIASINAWNRLGVGLRFAPLA
ncbi:carboxymuconolactone decarboxylase family protein [Robbsia sp. Bb-Pol-6]|uniref:Carboxymuconolactone decarboxylase family protein n=1 Tax=Robbsia betulipollinis TaxID=2981849 RepID=A0ABT3ZJ51_9BURK|nr:carboxymuconolactone decarboxylase family protein [Robbsia betulipollinis]MCY0386549.1 carboxymuconolactone decarboxylase family protein [Robbsia betulipollinis]